jgi:hypothetical protein
VAQGCSKLHSEVYINIHPSDMMMAARTSLSALEQYEAGIVAIKIYKKSESIAGQQRRIFIPLGLQT